MSITEKQSQVNTAEANAFHFPRLNEKAPNFLVYRSKRNSARNGLLPNEQRTLHTRVRSCY